jgi:hypothetical protein
MKQLPVLLLAFGLLACKKQALNYGTRITLVNAVPNQPAFFVAVGGDIISNSVVYAQPIYTWPVPAATTLVQWKRSTTAAYDSSFTTDFANGADFTLLFFDSANRYQTALLRDRWQQATSSNKAYLRFLPLAINARDLRLTNDTGLALASGRSFADFQLSEAARSFAPVDTTSANTLRLFNGSVPVDSLGPAALMAGKSYTIYVLGVLGAVGTAKPRLIMHQHTN